MLATKEKNKAAKKPRVMVDASGIEVPAAYVPKYDKLRDREVRKLVRIFEDERKRLEGVMRTALETVEKIKEARGEGVAERGNFQVCSFDGLARVEIVTRYGILLDDRALEAKRMMVEYVMAGLADVKDHNHRQAVLQVITDTFTPARNGCLRANMVVRLLNYKIMAKEWQAACAVLREAMTTSRSKSYINVATRRTHQDEWRTIRLDLADCWPAGYTVE